MASESRVPAAAAAAAETMSDTGSEWMIVDDEKPKVAAPKAVGLTQPVSLGELMGEPCQTNIDPFVISEFLMTNDDLQFLIELTVVYH